MMGTSVWLRCQVWYYHFCLGWSGSRFSSMRSSLLSNLFLQSSFLVFHWLFYSDHVLIRQLFCQSTFVPQPRTCVALRLCLVPGEKKTQLINWFVLDVTKTRLGNVLMLACYVFTSICLPPIILSDKVGPILYCCWVPVSQRIGLIQKINQHFG